MFLIIRGTLVVDGWRFSLNMGADRRCSAETLTSEYHGFMGAIARSMLWYVLSLVNSIFSLLTVLLKVATWFVVQFIYIFFFSSNSIAYVCLMLPHVIVIIIENSGRPVAFASKVFSLCCAALLGMLLPHQPPFFLLNFLQGLPMLLSSTTLSE